MNNALVLINKPVDMRSTTCVAMVRRQLDGLKVGHCGTLDSTASGLLVMVTGDATRFSEYIMQLPKVYRAVIQFGSETDSYDYSGEIIANNGFENLDVNILSDALFSFSGWRMQSPPPVSAVKINGKPAHKLARSGKNPDMDMKSRPVYFRQVKVIEPYNAITGTLELEIHCGKGTYIRSMAHDLGKITGTGAYVLSLRRVSVGNFNVDNANEIDSEYRFTNLDELAKNFTCIYVSEKDSKSFLNGMSILLSNSDKFSRGLTLSGNTICVSGQEFLGFGSYAGYDYVRPIASVKKC